MITILRYCPGCRRNLSRADFYSEKGTYCKECQKAKRKREYAALTDEQKKRRKDKRNSKRYKTWRQAYTRRYVAAQDPKSWYERRRAARLKHRYGVTPEWYDAKMLEQYGCCAICGAIPDGKLRFSVDHDHKCCPGRKSCGKCLRGILCQPCNAVLGFVDSHPDWMEKAQAFING